MSKEITEYCSTLSADSVAQHSVINLYHSRYSPFVLQRLVQICAKLLGCDVVMLNLEQDFSSLQQTLSTTFLGQTSIYWFSEFSSTLSKKKKTEWLDFLSKYQGPHLLIGQMTDSISLARGQTLVIDESYTLSGLQKTQFIPLQDLAIAYPFFSHVYRLKKQYSLEHLYVLFHYAHVIGKNSDLFFKHWFERLVDQDISLYYLSQLFFERNAQGFFTMWHKVASYYPEQFWVSFFSDQFFKGYWYIACKGQVRPDQKFMTFGLPFSFLKQDWKYYSLSDMQKNYTKIYALDGAIKSGKQSVSLDSVLISMFE